MEKPRSSCVAVFRPFVQISTEKANIHFGIKSLFFRKQLVESDSVNFHCHNQHVFTSVDVLTYRRLGLLPLLHKLALLVSVGFHVQVQPRFVDRKRSIKQGSDFVICSQVDPLLIICGNLFDH